MDLGAVERLIEETLAGGGSLLREVGVYLLRAGGKRLRPELVLLGARFGGERPAARLAHLAAAVELVHMATLLHDDVVDESAVRRGRPTANVRWDSQTSVLVGDYLFATAFEFVSRWAAADSWLALTGVVRTMAEGEIQELSSRGRLDVTEQDYLDRIKKKTALFIAECPQLGAMTADAADGCREALGRYGYCLGMAYQIMDDVLDLTADLRTLGKPTGNDLGRGVVTLPVIHGLTTSGEGRIRLQRILGRAGDGEADLKAVASILEGSGSVDYARGVAQEFAGQARQALAPLPPGPGRDRLEEIARFVLVRDR
ncbi:MAG: polyprenyl synthetase family protein [bacterium]|nr:polyprenyl synthetase family protein [bacterium]